MRLWPFYRVSFKTSLDADETLRRLHAEIAAEHMLPMGGLGNAYVGPVFDRLGFVGHRLADGASVRANIDTDPGAPRRMNALQPIIRVRVLPSPSGTTVRATFRPATIASLILLALCASVVLITSHLAIAAARGEHPLSWTILLGPGFLTVAWGVACFAFWEEADSNERLLRAILERA